MPEPACTYAGANSRHVELVDLQDLVHEVVAERAECLVIAV